MDNCVWKKYWDWVAHDRRGVANAYWETECGTSHTYNEATTELHDDCIYCFKCGKPIREDATEYERERYGENEDPDQARMEAVNREVYLGTRGRK